MNLLLILILKTVSCWEDSIFKIRTTLDNGPSGDKKIINFGHKLEYITDSASNGDVLIKYVKILL